MAQKRDEQEPRAEYWRGLIEAWAASGLTQTEFCEERGVSVASLRWWKWELGRRGEVDGRGGKAVAAVRSSPRAPSGLLPVRIVPSETSRSLELVGSAPCFEVILRRGERIRVPPDFDAASLQRLIAVVDAAC